MSLQIKTHLLAFALGALLCAGAVFYFTSGDAGIKKLQESKANIQHVAAALKSETSTNKKQLATSLKTIQAETTLKVGKATTQVAKLQAENIGLKKQVEALKLHISTQDETIYKHEALHVESLVALNQASRSLALKTAREKAATIGLSVGVPLLVVGGFVGGFYMAGVVR